ncbi:MAG: hypothetical protein R3D25_01345 [Geminicoccaceae bacterium]
MPDPPAEFDRRHGPVRQAVLEREAAGGRTHGQQLAVGGRWQEGSELRVPVRPAAPVRREVQGRVPPPLTRS